MFASIATRNFLLLSLLASASLLVGCDDSVEKKTWQSLSHGWEYSSDKIIKNTVEKESEGWTVVKKKKRKKKFNYFY